MKLFRVWVHETNSYDPTNIVITNNNPFQIYQRFWEWDDIDYGYGHDEEKYLSPDEYVLEFSLNIPDKNGKIIFEGDICAERHNDDWLKQFPTTPKIQYYLCERANYGFEIKLSSFHRYPFHENKFIPHVSKDIEIVGNIHENPELLNEHLDNPQLLEKFLGH